MSKQRIAYTPTGGVCSKMMIVDAEDNVITGVQIVGGCQGNTQGLSKLLVGMEVQDAIQRLEGIDCRERGKEIELNSAARFYFRRIKVYLSRS